MPSQNNERRKHPYNICYNFSHNCKKKGNFHCSACMQTNYCSLKCQKQHWKFNHYLVCDLIQFISKNHLRPPPIIKTKTNHKKKNEKNMKKRKREKREEEEEKEKQQIKKKFKSENLKSNLEDMKEFIENTTSIHTLPPEIILLIDKLIKKDVDESILKLLSQRFNKIVFQNQKTIRIIKSDKEGALDIEWKSFLKKIAKNIPRLTKIIIHTDNNFRIEYLKYLFSKESKVKIETLKIKFESKKHALSQDEEILNYLNNNMSTIFKGYIKKISVQNYYIPRGYDIEKEVRSELFSDFKNMKILILEGILQKEIKNKRGPNIYGKFTCDLFQYLEGLKDSLEILKIFYILKTPNCYKYLSKFTKLKKLTIGFLDFNTIRRGNLSDTSFLKSLVNLENLYLYNDTFLLNNNLDFLIHTKNLKIIHLDSPSGLKDEDLQSLKTLNKLKKLILFYTKLSGNFMKYINNLPELEYLSIKENKHENNLNISELKNNKSIKILRLKNSTLRQTQENHIFHTLQKIWQLNIENTNVRMEYFENFNKQMIHLQYLDISTNERIIGDLIIPIILRFFPNLVFLNIQSIRFISSETLRKLVNLKKLQTLYLGTNNTVLRSGYFWTDEDKKYLKEENPKMFIFDT